MFGFDTDQLLRLKEIAVLAAKQNTTMVEYNLPYFNHRGDQFSIYIEKRNDDSFLLSDDAYLAHDIEDTLSFCKEQEERIAQICQTYDIKIQNQEFFLACSALQLEDALQRFLRTLIEIHNTFF
jgi:hypothetical protein